MLVWLTLLLLTFLLLTLLLLLLLFLPIVQFNMSGTEGKEKEIGLGRVRGPQGMLGQGGQNHEIGRRIGG